MVMSLHTTPTKLSAYIMHIMHMGKAGLACISAGTDPQSQLTSGETFGARLVATAEAILLELIPARRFQWTLLPISGKVHTLPGPKRASACSKV